MNRSPITFNPLDRTAEIYQRERNLPHWYQPGAAIFVTFRTFDSMPKDVVMRWQQELEAWLDRSGLPTGLGASVVHGRFPDHEEMMSQLIAAQAFEFKRLSDRIFHRTLDECHGRCLLRQPELADEVAGAILHFDGDRYDLDRFVIMPNHVHAIVQFRTGFDLSVVGQSWMRFSARTSIVCSVSLERSGNPSLSITSSAAIGSSSTCRTIRLKNLEKRSCENTNFFTGNASRSVERLSQSFGRY